MVYLTSDIHGAFDIHKINPDEFHAGHSLTRNDYVLICGDFGCLWDGGSSDRFWLNWLESLPWTTLFIDGNHENFDVLKSYPTVFWNGGEARQIRSNVFQLKRGEIYTFGGKTWLTIGGGYSHDLQFRQEGKNWWKDEILTREEADHALSSLEAHDWKVDCVITHDIFSSHEVADSYPIQKEAYGPDRIDQQAFLEEIRKKTDYRAWFFGHYHQDRLDFFDGRPVQMLYDTVEEVDTLIEQAQAVHAQRENGENQSETPPAPESTLSQDDAAEISG